MKEIKINTKHSYDSYTIYIDNNLDKFFHVMNENRIKKNDKIFIVTEDNIFKKYEYVIKKFEKNFDSDIKCYCFGHENIEKDIISVKKIYSFLIDNHGDEDSVLIALGGETIVDIVGFVALTYMRGIKYINIPTTFLSQIYNAVAGKVGCDYKGVKNAVGSYYNPQFIFIATNFLKDLSKKQFQEGISEVIKYGLIKNKDLLEYVRNNIKGIKENENDKIHYIIKNSLTTRKYFIEKDSGQYKVGECLKFGEKIGNMLRIYSNEKLSYRESNTLGMLVTLKISENILGLSKEVYNNVEDMLIGLGLPVKYKVDNYNLFMYCINRNEKNISKIKFVLLKELGKCKINIEVKEDDILQGIKQSISKGD